ncbi:hypothetical protein CTI12_AA418520 [Artemisia annua]|uniref:Uncharacterized protein n=1 Tax=Artemisia annua TaxID=35608 RepID=A0A2U1M5E7_ARTAN|nr:hypothetical protein CTI12_AA418520 [Artemisia annua]
MAPKFPKCMKIAHQIGDRRIDRVLHEVFCREKKAYMTQEKIYFDIIDEILARVQERHGVISEMRKFVSENVLEEALADLKMAEQDDFAEIGRLIEMAHAASARVGVTRKLCRVLFGCLYLAFYKVYG